MYPFHHAHVVASFKFVMLLSALRSKHSILKSFQTQHCTVPSAAAAAAAAAGL
jgi:hypothetical protein